MIPLCEGTDVCENREHMTQLRIFFLKVDNTDGTSTQYSHVMACVRALSYVTLTDCTLLNPIYICGEISSC